MRSVLTALALVLSTSLIGCRSAHIEEAYTAADEDGVRRTDCIHPDWPEFFLIVEMWSFREDTLLWPVLVPEQTVDPGYWGSPPRPRWEEEETDLYQNIAVGKSDGKIVQSISIPQGEDADGNPIPFPAGTWRMDLYLNDEGSPRESVGWQFNGQCPFSPIPDTY